MKRMRHFKSAERNRRGFTLLELMIVLVEQLVMLGEQLVPEQAQRFFLVREQAREASLVRVPARGEELAVPALPGVR